jgi:hypothetical protein
VERGDGDARLQQTKDPSSGSSTGNDAFERSENERVVGNEETDSGLNRGGYNFFGHLMAHPDPPGGSVPISNLEAVAVPGSSPVPVDAPGESKQRLGDRWH